MERPLAVGSASGVVSTLAFAFLRSLIQDHHPIEVPPLQLPVECPHIELEDIPLWTFLAGILCGVLLGLLIDCLSLARQRWRRFVLSAFAQDRRPGRAPRDSSRPLHKVLA